MLLSDMDAGYVGAAVVDEIYHGADLVWSSAPVVQNADVTFAMTNNTPAITGDPIVSSGNIVNAGGVSLISYTTVAGAYPNNVLQINPDQTTPDTAGTYLSITLTGTDITLDGVDIKGARGGSATPRGVLIRANADGGAFSTVLSQDIPTIRPTLTDFSATPSIGPASTIEVRIIAYAPIPTNTIELDDLVLSITSTT